MKYWEDKNFEEYEINYIIVCGHWISGLKDFDDVIRALRGDW